MTIPLRGYQIEAIEKIKAALSDGKRKFICGLPCGTGKTILAMSAVAGALRRGNDCLWLCNREELTSQALESFRVVAPDLEKYIGVVKAERNDFDARFVIASIQTISGKDRSVEKERSRLNAMLDEALAEGGVSDQECVEIDKIQKMLNDLPQPSFPRLEAMNPDRFKVVIYDEAHHATSKTSHEILKRFKPGVMVMGLTATAERGDGVSLASEFPDGIVYSMSMKEAIRCGYIVDFEYRSVWMDLDLDSIRSTAGDFNSKQLEDALERAGVVEATVKGILQHARNRKSLCFTLTIEQSRKTAEALHEAGLLASYISCDTPMDERKKILLDFKNDKIKIVCSAGVLTEGFDERSADCAVLARPTKSRVLYVQQIGRVLRTFPGKKTALVLDFTASGSKQKPITIRELCGVMPNEGETSEEAEIREIKEKDALGIPRDIVAASMLKAAEAAKLERESWRAAWSIIKHNIKSVVEARVLPGRAKRKCVIWTTDADKQSWKVAAWMPSSGGVYYLDKRGIALDFAESISRQAMRDMGQKGIFDASATWRSRAPSAASCAFAKKCGIVVDAGMNGGDVADCLNSVTAGWDLKKLIANSAVELTFDTPESFRDALRAERESSEAEYEGKKEAKREVRNGHMYENMQQTEVPF